MTLKAGARLPDGTLKTISEAKEVTGEHKYGPRVQLYCPDRPACYCATTSPSLADVSHGMLRRLMVIPFDRRFTDKDRDRRSLSAHLGQRDVRRPKSRFKRLSSVARTGGILQIAACNNGSQRAVDPASQSLARLSPGTMPAKAGGPQLDPRFVHRLPSMGQAGRLYPYRRINSTSGATWSTSDSRCLTGIGVSVSKGSPCDLDPDLSPRRSPAAAPNSLWRE